MPGRAARQPPSRRARRPSCQSRRGRHAWRRTCRSRPASSGRRTRRGPGCPQRRAAPLITAGTVRRRRTILADRIILADRQIEILRGALGGIRRGAVRGGRLTGTVLTRTIAVDGEVRGAALLNAVSVGLVVRVRFGFDGVGPLRRPGGPLRAAVLEGRAAVLEGRAAVLLTGPVEVRIPALGRNARTGLVHRLLRWCGAVLQERSELLGISRVHAEYHPRAPPRLLDRVTDIAGDRWQRFCRQAVPGTPAVPRPLKHCCGALRTGYEPWIRHCAILP